MTITDITANVNVPIQNFQNLAQVYEESHGRTFDRDSNLGPNPLKAHEIPRLNLLSLQADGLPLGQDIKLPTVVRRLDLAYRYAEKTHHGDQAFWKKAGWYTYVIRDTAME